MKSTGVEKDAKCIEMSHIITTSPDTFILRFIQQVHGFSPSPLLGQGAQRRGQEVFLQTAQATQQPKGHGRAWHVLALAALLCLVGIEQTIGQSQLGFVA